MTPCDIITLAASRGITLALAPSGDSIRAYGDQSAMTALRPILVENKPAIVAHLAAARQSWQSAIAAIPLSPAINWLTDLMAVPGRLEAAAGEQEALLDKSRGEREVKTGNRKIYIANPPRWWPMRATARQVWNSLTATAPGTAERQKAVAATEWLWRLWRGDSETEGAAIGWRDNSEP